MNTEIEDPDKTAERLEAALERIAEAARRQASAPPAVPQGERQTERISLLAERLDLIIANVRAALADKTD